MESSNSIIDCQPQINWLDVRFMTDEAPKTVSTTQPADVEEVRAALRHISADDYQTWIKVGMCLKAGGIEFSVWNDWSATSSKYDPAEMENKWNGFAVRGLSLGSVFYLAMKEGYKLKSVEDHEGHQSQSQAAKLLQLIEADPSVRVFKVPAGDTFAVFPKETKSGASVAETVPLSSVVFDAFLRRLYRATYHNLCGTETINTVKGYLEGDAPTESGVSIRVAHHGTRIYVDLANDNRDVVEISADGWKLMSSDSCPVRFWHPRGMMELPRPERGGDLSCLAEYMNLRTGGALDLKKLARVILYLVSTFVDGPLLMLAIVGEKGSAKTTQAKIIRWILDPNDADVMSPPANDRDLALSCRNQWAIALDNVSYISAARSDQHCRIATGASWRERQLHTNSEEFMYNFRRPQILTSIKDVIIQSDLADRKLKLKLEAIGKTDRQTERQIFDTLKIELPRIIGALFDVVAGALRESPNVDPAELPRMADVAKFLLAAEKHLGWEEGTVASMFEEEVQSDAQDMLEREPFAAALLEYVAGKGGTWEATPTEVLDALLDKQTFGANQLRWPRTGRALKDKLKELASDFRELGFEYSQESGGRRRYSFRYSPTNA